MPNSIRFGRAGTESILTRTTNLPPSSGFTMMAWVRARGNGSGFAGNQPALLVYSNSSTANGYWCYWADASFTLGLTNNGIASGTGSTTPVDSWHHLALVVNGTSGTNALLYKDGALDISITASSVTVNQLYLASDAFNEWADCNIAAIKLYNRALTASELVLEMPFAMPVSSAGLNSAYPLSNGWDVAASGIVVPRGVLTRWPDVSGQTGSEWTETGTLDTDLGPPIQFAPSVQRMRARYFVGGAPPPVTVVQRRTLGTVGRVGTRRAA